MQPRRDWTTAREKVEREGMCRIPSVWPDNRRAAIGCDGPLEAAHIIGREHDKRAPVTRYSMVTNDATRSWRPYVVVPDRIVPLCKRHHQMFDDHEFDLLGHLTPQEEAQAVLDAGGLENARRRLCPSEYKAKVG